MIRRPPRATRTDTLFPTRRSSDLVQAGESRDGHGREDGLDLGGIVDAAELLAGCRRRQPAVELRRSEEHTSELQSLMRISYAVFCLKKKISSITYKK